MNVKFLLLLIVLVLLSVSFVSAEDVSLNSSQLPFNGSFNISLSMAVNKTAFFNQSVNDSRVILDFPSSVFFNNTNSSVVVVNYTVLNFSSQSDVNLSSVLNISNSYNNDSALVPLNVFVSFPSSLNVSEVFTMFVDQGDFHVDITTNLLPAERSFTFELLGLAGESFDIGCDEWFSCPESAVFGADNTSSVTINVSIPNSAVVGVQQRFIYFSTSNQSKSGVITFNITDPVVTFDEYTWDLERCFSDDGLYVTYECMQEYVEWNKNQTAQMFDYLYQLQRDQNFTCEPNVTTEYLMVGNISDEVYNDYDACKTDLSTYRSDFNNCSSKLLTANNENSLCNTDLSTCKNSLLDKDSAEKRSILQTIKDKDIEYANLRSKQTKKMWWTIIVCVLLILLGLFILWYRNYYFSGGINFG